MRRKIGVVIECFRLGVKDGICKAAELGVDGIQVYATGGEVSAAMSRTARQDFKSFVNSKGLVISALCGDFLAGFMNPDANDELVAKSKQIVDLAVDLGTTVVTTHIGHLPDDDKDKRWVTCYEAVSELAKYAEDKGVTFATETGPEEPEVLRRFLDSIGSTGLGVNYDPANFIICGYDCLRGVEVLKDYIVHTHAKDGVYGPAGEYGAEVALSEGDVNFPEYIQRLDAIGYDGFLTIEREVGENPVSDIATAIEYLRQL